MCCSCWEQFAKALEKSDGGEYEHWRFRYLPSFPTSILAEPLSSRHICSLELNNVGRGAHDVYHFLCEFLECSCSIKRLILRDMNGFYDSYYNDGNNTCRFCDAVEASESLEELSLVNLDLGFDIESSGDYYLPLVLDASRNLKYLSLDNSDLGEDMGRVIADFIGGNPSVKHLVLGGQPLSDDVLRRIASALLSNTNLRILDLGLVDWIWMDKGLKILRKALFSMKMQMTRLFAPKMSGLNAVVAASNHTCSIHYTAHGQVRPLRGPGWLVEEDEQCPELTLLNALNRNEDPAENRKWKILSILYATKCNGFDNEMDDVPLRLIPDVLSLISSGARAEDTAADDETEAVCSNNADNDDMDESSCLSAVAEEMECSYILSEEGSIVSYDSELDDLESAFDESIDEVYDDFHKSFSDPTSFTGRRARVTMIYHLLQKYGPPLMDETASPRVGVNYGS